jgi:sterol 14-demethylase
METWGAEGQMNPFQDIYDLVFQMTVRIASCEELAADPKSVQKMSDLFWKLEKSATPVSLLFPWFPGTGKRNKEQATKDLYVMLSHYVDIRRKAEAPNSDAIDILIANGEDNPAIIGVGLIFIFIFTCLLSSGSPS